ncbi:MAG: TVP38/TMEM64 family protein [Proteobacteria bacterium]|nr:TVP38/TMEM64 family protein [Pseudomonadota bacterium]
MNEPTPVRKTQSRRAQILKIVAVLLVFVGGAAALRESGLLELMQDRELLQQRVDELGVLAVVAYLAMWVPLQVLLSQAFLPTVAGGIMFGWLGGGILAVIGAALGCTAQFLVARYVFRDTAEWLVLSRFPEIHEIVEERGVATLILLRLLYAPSFALNIVGGISSMPLRKFALAYGALLPQSLLVCFVADSFYRFGWSDMPPIRWATMVGIVVVGVLGYRAAVKRWPELRIRKKRRKIREVLSGEVSADVE